MGGRFFLTLISCSFLRIASFKLYSFRNGKVVRARSPSPRHSMFGVRSFPRGRHLGRLAPSRPVYHPLNAG
ncbi:hypothetical protein K438DRAFT_1844082 [Mycena galopus ATCC 62051]|nr:hypothetical protein K438DRAFT_1844082 [Mycena galopus ATCC 62051]